MGTELCYGTSPYLKSITSKISTLNYMMSDERRDSTSSLQRKKPPWLKLEIPANQPPMEESSSNLGQPSRHQPYLRSVSMPPESTRISSPPNEHRRPAFQRQTSITQTIKR
ncbi:hypothetical protein scyTo_0007535 [Scyliorhinus torazame]|uniref:Uncharacterized protein n=1 Tax=Scyliorhinus torazame TaxID=75743 RepID=A0A401NU61_SCYTO|nr:hypothetical protein [Scyliorhinus torazame]